MKTEFNRRLKLLYSEKNANSTFLSEIKYMELINKIKEIKSKTTAKTGTEYKALKKYDVMMVGEVEKLVVPILPTSNSIKYYVYNEEIFEIINAIHFNIGHGGRNKMIYEINLKYKNITREIIMLYLSKFVYNMSKKRKYYKKGFSCTTNPLLRNEFALSGRLDRHASSAR